MERDVREFLGEFSSDELVALEVLSPNRLLQGPSVDNLIELMCNQGMAGLFSTRSRWSLTTKGTFRNKGRSGRVEDLVDKGDVFKGQNKHINPYYRSKVVKSPRNEVRDGGMDITEFLECFSADELVELGVLSPFGSRYLLQGPNVDNLIALMRSQGVASLFSTHSRWSLTIEGTFRNRGRSGQVEGLVDKGDVFKGQNSHINPYF